MSSSGYDHACVRVRAGQAEGNRRRAEGARAFKEEGLCAGVCVSVFDVCMHRCG